MLLNRKTKIMINIEDNVDSQEVNKSVLQAKMCNLSSDSLMWGETHGGGNDGKKGDNNRGNRGSDNNPGETEKSIKKKKTLI